MTFVNTGSRKIKIDIVHSHAAKLVKGYLTSGNTTCRIMDENDKLLATAVTYCGPGDQFRRKEGVKRSLKRALAVLDLTKAERTVIWHKIQNRHAVTA